MTHTLDLNSIRGQFPGLSRSLSGQTCAFFDGPAGSQIPQCVVDAVCHYLQHTNANHGGPFCTSRESDAILDRAHERVADFLGAESGQCVAFGANMTTLTLAFSRAMARTWNPGDEIIVTQLDHDANVSPWVTAAADAGVVVHHVGVDLDDCTLRMDQFQSVLSSRTRLLAVGLASNATGTINPVAEMARQAHQVGAVVFADAVHFAPHRLIDFASLGVDFLTCSAYKFFGPHVGILCGHREQLNQLAPYKLRPATDDLPGKWMTGTQNHEGIAGTAAAVDYLASLASETISDTQPRSALVSAFDAIQAHENQLLE
ncbi:MAG: cysteine desulfurase-like protein, partial [Planctomycetaceae bacterium]